MSSREATARRVVTQLALLVALVAAVGCVRTVGERTDAGRRRAARQYFDDGQVALVRQNYPQALVDFTEAIRIDPDYAPPQWERGQIFLGTPGMTQQGERDIARARELPLAGAGFPDYRRLTPVPIPAEEGERLASILAPTPVPADAVDVAPNLVLELDPPANEGGSEAAGPSGIEDEDDGDGDATGDSGPDDGSENGPDDGSDAPDTDDGGGSG